MQMHKHFLRNTLLFILSLGATSCAVGPDYKPLTTTELKVPNSWHEKLAHNGSNVKLIDWWGQFNDPTLTYFIQSSIKTNPTLAQSVAKIEEARAC